MEFDFLLDASFRIPDQRGWQAWKEKIDQNFEFDEKLECEFDLEKIGNKLVESGYKVLVSQDPGRYICNWI